MEGIDEQLPRLTSRWFIDFLTLDPRPLLRQVKVPILAMAGELDLQVPPDPNQSEIEKALRATENKDVTVSTLVGLNHLLQAAETGHPSEYARIEETISPAALEIVAEWIANRTLISCEEVKAEP